MVCVALLSNPCSTGNRSLLPRIRSFCAEHGEVFHYEVENASQIGQALRTIARVKPKVLAINGGDGTVQATLTELYQGSHFAGLPPPVAVLPNGKTNLIAQDLGADGDPIRALERVLALAHSDLAPHIVSRELIAFSDGSGEARPVLGMFLGGAGLADAILYCRHKIYPLGLPNGPSHFLAFAATLVSMLFGLTARFLPPRPGQVEISMVNRARLKGSFQILMVTTLERLLLHAHSAQSDGTGALRLMAVERRPLALLRALFAAMSGKLGRTQLTGVHVGCGDEIRIEGERNSIILDGELFEVRRGRPIVLKPTRPVSFLRLAAGR